MINEMPTCRNYRQSRSDITQERHLSIDRILVENTDKNQHFHGPYWICFFQFPLIMFSFSQGDIKKWIVVSCHEETILKSSTRMLNTDFDEYLKNSQSQGTFF